MKIAILFYATASLFLGCAKHKEQPPTNDLAALREKVELYKSLNSNIGDVYGYVHSKCDGVGFTALCKTAQGCGRSNILASESESEPGRWYRYPTHDCFPLESRSDDSNDHALMRMVYFYSIGDLDTLRREQDYLKRSGGYLGRDDGTADGHDAATFAFPSLLSKLVNSSHYSTGPIPSGFRGHLFLLYVLLDSKVTGILDKTTIWALQDFIRDNPRNALAQALLHKYTDGDYSAAISTLMDESIFPADRLPTSAERCEEYLWQRDEHTDDWLPCPVEAKVHSGTDLLFAAWVFGA